MKYALLFTSLFILAACSQQRNDTLKLQGQIDSLQSKLNNVYTPGLGDFMSSIQVHHNKLWFAGKNENWRLADFEVHEIQEAIDDIEKFQVEREETKKMGMIKPALDSIIRAIEQKSSTTFNNSYLLLTNTCNSCHQATNFEFNKVTVPDTPPFSNQVFKNQ
jgi:hypothetical protein